MATISEKIAALKPIIAEAWPTFDWAKQLLDILTDLSTPTEPEVFVFPSNLQELTYDEALAAGFTMTNLTDMINGKYNCASNGDNARFSIQGYVTETFDEFFITFACISEYSAECTPTTAEIYEIDINFGAEEFSCTLREQ